MIVKLHDGTEGDLVGWARPTLPSDTQAAPGTWYPQIVVLREESTRDVRAVLWHGEPTLQQFAEAELARAVALAGLCFWPDPDGRDLDLSPWVRDRLDRARSWGGPSAGFLPVLPSEVRPIPASTTRRTPGWG